MQLATRINDLIDDIVAANRILAAENVVDAYGHVSARHPANPGRYLIARARPPELITADDIMTSPSTELSRTAILASLISKDISTAQSTRPDQT